MKGAIYLMFKHPTAQWYRACHALPLYQTRQHRLFGPCLQAYGSDGVGYAAAA